MEIGKGTPLIAIDGSNPYPRNTAYPLTVGALYFVDRIWEGQPWQNNGGKCPQCNSPVIVSLTQKPSWGYSVCKFRPLNDGDTSMVKADRELEEAL